jgi:hypothetical protein
MMRKNVMSLQERTEKFSPMRKTQGKNAREKRKGKRKGKRKRKRKGKRKGKFGFVLA